jgi:hypothetical protein
MPQTHAVVVSHISGGVLLPSIDTSGVFQTRTGQKLRVSSASSETGGWCLRMGVGRMGDA